MVNINHILKRRNCPTLEHQLYDDIEEAMEFQEQEYGKFPPRDHYIISHTSNNYLSYLQNYFCDLRQLNLRFSEAYLDRLAHK